MPDIIYMITLKKGQVVGTLLKLRKVIFSFCVSLNFLLHVDIIWLIMKKIGCTCLSR